eukprot:5297841-Amphidinium_carterae.1
MHHNSLAWALSLPCTEIQACQVRSAKEVRCTTAGSVPPAVPDAVERTLSSSFHAPEVCS